MRQTVPTAANEITGHLEHVRRRVNKEHERQERSRIGQFLTPAPIAHYMAGMFRRDIKDARILDAGAGVGVLAAAAVETLIGRKGHLRSIQVTAFENDERVLPHLKDALIRCRAVCAEAKVAFAAETRCEDFVAASVDIAGDSLFAGDSRRFTHAILNPPYKKITAQSRTRKLLRSSGVEVSNLYAAFVWLAARMLEPRGELVAITPRSFCNGPYFRRFRLALLDMMAVQQIHVFESRKKAFGDDDVLQENVILHAVRGGHRPRHIAISSSGGSDFHNVNLWHMPYERVVLPDDKDAFIHLILNDDDEDTVCRM